LNGFDRVFELMRFLLDQKMYPQICVSNFSLQKRGTIIFMDVSVAGVAGKPGGCGQCCGPSTLVGGGTLHGAVILG